MIKALIRVIRENRNTECYNLPPHVKLDSLQFCHLCFFELPRDYPYHGFEILVDLAC
jgi:hypothetical protein